jgi:hypothetical protein
MPESTARKCVRCGGELSAGVRFCVRCGTNNLDSDASRLATAECGINAGNRKQSFQRVMYWWRYLTKGLRR